MLQSFKEKLVNITNQYDNLIKMGIVPIDNITIESIVEDKKNLENERFLVSFTGQIKAGKSTLINALIFGDDILPVDDTPHTAKITIIKYGEKPKFLAQFYNKKEWYNLESDKEYFDKFLKDDVERSIKNGIFLDNYVKEKNHTETVNDISLLKKYVSAKGDFTPFIKDVTILYPSDILKTIEFVDTPGINDPNKFRSKITKDWIIQANANIYVTYAGRPLDASDIEFIDNFLLHVNHNKRIIAVNKIDIIENDAELHSYVEHMRNDEKFKIRGIFDNESDIIYVSALGMIISKMLESGKNLNDDYQFYKNKLIEKDLLDPNKNGFNQLEKILTRKIMDNKGTSILLSHINKIKSIFVKNERLLQEKLETNKIEISNYMSTIDELNDKKQQIEKSISMIGDDFKKFRFNIDKIKENLLKKIREEVRKLKNTIREDCFVEFKRIHKTNLFKNEVLWVVKNNFEKGILNFNSNDIMEELKIKVEYELDEIKSKYNEIFDNNLFLLIISPNIDDLIEHVFEQIDDIFNESQISGIVDESTLFWQRWFDTKGGLENIISAIMSELNEFLEDAFNDKLIYQIKDAINTEVNSFVSNIENTLREHLKNLEIKINEAIANINNRKEIIKKLEKEREELISKLQFIQTEKSKNASIVEDNYV